MRMPKVARRRCSVLSFEQAEAKGRAMVASHQTTVHRLTVRQALARYINYKRALGQPVCRDAMRTIATVTDGDALRRPYTASWGSWCGIRVSSDMIAGSGLRDGDANISTVAPYAQFNAGIAREFLLPDDPKPMTVRFDVVNLFDSIYFIRDGSGIGVFAPQYGPRRGYFAGISKKF